MRCSPGSGRRIPRPWGFSYVEILLATLLLAISLVPALDALSPGVRAGAGHQALTADHYRLAGRLEQVLAEPFDALDAAAQAAGSASVASSYSDALGTPRRRLVYLARYDGDNADGDADPYTGVDPDLLWARLEIEDTAGSLETLTTR